MPAQTATTENADLERALAFERRAHEQAAQRVEPLPYGCTLRDEARYLMTKRIIMPSSAIVQSTLIHMM